MSINISTPWHKESFNRFIEDRLPQLLSARLPIAGYHIESTEPYTCCVRIILASSSQEIEVKYTDIPQPDDEGVFKIDGKPHVVIPVASDENLNTAEIRCVGEQLYDYFEKRLGQPPDGLPWDASLIRAWLPLDTWMHEGIQEHYLQRLDETNWISRYTHLRRILIPNRKKVFTPGHFGRTCPFETPEGPNIGRVLTVAVGAKVLDGKLAVVDERPEATLGLSASMIPFLEHDDPSGLLMGANMMRQWLRSPEPEPALVQTGNEPAVPEFWCGRNLLTAYISWDANTFEDGIVISQSCARRLNFFYPVVGPASRLADGGLHSVEPGDKLSNRHGAKGVVTRILPDEEMPHLADGTPVELIFSLCGLPSRMNFGQVREALMGRIARAEGKPAIVRPFGAPTERELRERLLKAGLPEDGMETLIHKGKKLAHRSAVGWVYWGCTAHIAEDKIRASVDRSPDCQEQDEAAYLALREAKAFENILEHFNTRASGREDADKLRERVAAGKVEQAGSPSPKFADLIRRLAVGGIGAELKGEKLTFKLDASGRAKLKLSRPLSHPWFSQHKLTEIGQSEDLPEYKALVEANAKMESMLQSRAPERLMENAFSHLEARVKEFLDALLTPAHLQFDEKVLFSGRAVIAPGEDLHIDQVGLPEEIAWTLFSPMVIRELGSEEEVRKRSEHAAQVLDDIMARSWVVIYRSPALTPASFLAFHPVRYSDSVVRIHPSACYMINADFDGDQVAVFLPLTEAAQKEAGERLSIAGHLERDPASLFSSPLIRMDALLGLAKLSLTSKGLMEIAELMGTEVAINGKILTGETINEAMRNILKRYGAEKFFEALQRLWRRGFEIARGLGASMNPFPGSNLELPPEPESDDPSLWDAYAEEIMGRLAIYADFSDNDLGPLCLLVRSGARGSWHQLAALVGSRGAVQDVQGRPVSVRRGLRDGLTPQELYALAVISREQIAKYAFEWEQFGGRLQERKLVKGYNVLARAMRAKNPGVVFGRAAAMGEVDPLTDADSRLFVGLPPK